MDYKQLRLHIDGIKNRVAQIVSHDLPAYVGTKGMALFKRNFLTQSFFGAKWKDVRRRTHPPKGKKGQAAARRQILVGSTGNLRRSIGYKVGNGYVEFGTDAEYGAVHNQGLKAGRGKGFTMPRRQFIGHHAEVDKEVRKAIERLLKS